MKEAEFGTKMRLLEVMRSLLDNPYGYTMDELSKRHNYSKGTIKDDFRVFRNAGFVLDYDERYRYAFKENDQYRSLKDLLHFSEEDQLLLEEAIDQIADYNEKGERLKRKLSSLYDYHRLGHSYLRKPYLTKIDLLLQAKAEKRVAVLVNYKSSNSHSITDRIIEPFHISPADDMLHSYDRKRNELRHFRISRFSHVTITDKPWEYEKHHNIKLTDPFRIVDSNQVLVRLRLKVGALNELLERFPLSKRHIIEDGQDVFEFQCKVNHKFYGLSNFILGNYHFLVEVLEPDTLLDHLNETIKGMKF